MSSRRILTFAAAASLLALGAYAAYGYFSTASAIKRLTGWTLPDAAVLRTSNVEGDPFAGERNYLFELPGSLLPVDAYCASLNLPAAGPGSAPKVTLPVGKVAVPTLDTQAVCSRTEVNQQRKTALSIEATRNTLVIRFIYR